MVTMFLFKMNRRRRTTTLVTLGISNFRHFPLGTFSEYLKDLSIEFIAVKGKGHCPLMHLKGDKSTLVILCHVLLHLSELCGIGMVRAVHLCREHLNLKTTG